MTNTEVREKLTELIQCSFDKCCSMICGNECEYFDKYAKMSDRSCQAKLFADHLIANGVTFAKDTNDGGKDLKRLAIGEEN